MNPVSAYETETFGILTDDDVYLDCLLARPPGMQDGNLKALVVWVPRYPLTKNSVLTCARREVIEEGTVGTTAHLAFDLRGTGDSEGGPGERDFESDLNGIAAWANERFGPVEINFRGLPDGSGEANLLPIKPAVALEYYHYPSRPPGKSAGSVSAAFPVVYLSTYGSFGHLDESLCEDLAGAGFDVYGLDPLRFLLHASGAKSLDPANLLQQWRFFRQSLSIRPVLVGQPISAGLVLLWAAMDQEISGVIAIGEAQSAFARNDIFDNRHMYTFFLGRHVHRIAPRPVAYVMPENQEPSVALSEELDALYQSSGQPRRLERAPAVNLSLILSQLSWIAEHLESSGKEQNDS